LLGQGGAQGLKLGQQIPPVETGHLLGNGLAAAGDHHRLPSLHRIQKAGELGLGFSHRPLPHDR
jgi:hypothetical protein